MLDAAPGGAPQQLAADAPCTVTLTASDWQTVLTGLGEAPWRVAAPVIGRIMQQITAQAQASAPAADPEDARDG